MLATPYFLGRYIPDNPDAPARGKALQRVIQHALTELWPGELPTTRQELLDQVDEARRSQGNKGAVYYFFLLELRYIRQYFSLRTEPVRVVDMYGFVNVSETRFHEHLRQATTELGKRLLQQIRPTLRLERPRLISPLIGRDEVVAHISTHLEHNRSVAMSGSGGVGKTAVGTAIFNTWSTSPVFWYTFRPGLNDNLDNVLFSLGHFLNQWGASGLWLQLLANEGKLTDAHQALGFLRHDLLAFDAPPLLCFDELDLLQTGDWHPGQPLNNPLLEFVESLRGLSPLLLIGQRALLETDHHYVLPPLSLTETQILLEKAGLPLDEALLHRVQGYTAGNPRLLELYANLIKTGDKATDLLQMHTSPSAQPLFYRLWKRIDPQERDLLNLLAVFRTLAPLDALPQDSAALNNLIHRNLVIVDQADGVTTLSFFRHLIYHELSADQRQAMHQQAALIRVERGEYTAAAYHYRQAEAFTTAVEVWYLHQDQEILRGQAETARDIFRDVPAQTLTGKSLKQLKIIQNRLHLLAGDAEQLLKETDATDRALDEDEEITADALYQTGQAHAILGQTDEALENYDEAIATLSRLSTKIVEINFHRGQMFLREINAQAARQEAQVARYQVEWLQGLIEMMAGNFEQAQTHYQTALGLVQPLKDDARIAKVHQGLALVAGFQGKVDLAEEHADIAMAHFKKIGNRVQLEGMRAELAGVYLNARQFEKVIAPAESALQFFEQIRHEPWIAPICNNLAEAYLEVGQLEKARAYAFRVLELENPRARPHALYTLGLVHQQQGGLTDAKACFREGIQLAQQNEDPFIEAYLHRVLGQLYLSMDESTAGSAELETARGLFTQMGLAGEVAEIDAIISVKQGHPLEAASGR